MPYRPSYGLLFRPAGSVFGAIPLTSFGAAVAGTFLTLTYMLLDDFSRASERGLFWELAPDILNRALNSAVFALPFGIFIGTFLVAGYLVMFGAPMALLLRSRLDSALGVALSAGTALLASLIAYAAMFDGFDRPFNLAWEASAIVLAFALPAALLYHRSVVLLLEEPD